MRVPACGDTAFSKGAVVVGGAPLEYPPSPGSGEDTGAGQLLLPSPSLTLSVELVRALLNEPASMKVDEVRPGPKRSSRLHLGGRSRKAPSAQSAGWLSCRVGSWASFPLFCECCSSAITWPWGLQ